MRTTDVTESRWVRAAQAGDADAFGRLVLEHALVARRVGYAVLRSWEEADDVVQDAALAAWQAIDRFDPKRAFRPWFLRIVSNAALDQLRRRKIREVEPLAEGVPSRGESPEDAAHRSLLRDHVGQALAELPERQRVAVTLFDLEGYSHGEIAAILGVPEGTVRSYVFHARRALRAALGATVEGST
jgi:RNA polymerase sigma-70 factor (ECF subfamily)